MASSNASRPQIEVAAVASGTSGSAPSLRRNFWWALAGNAIIAASQWLVLVTMAKLGTQADVGRFALALAIVLPIISIASLQLRTLQSTDARREFTFGHYFGMRLAGVGGSWLCLGAVVVAAQYSGEFVTVLLALALSRLIESVSDVFYGLHQQRERMDRIAVSLIVRGALQLVVFILVFAATRNLLISTLALAGISLAVLLAYDIPAGRRSLRDVGDSALRGPQPESLQPLWSWPSARRIAWLGLPISFVVTANSFAGYIPRYVVADAWGEAQLGVFAAMFYMTVVGGMVIGAVADPASPKLARYFAAGDRAGYRRLIVRLVTLAASLGFLGFSVAAVAGGPLLSMLYRPEYAQHLDAFLWMMAAGLPMYVASVLGVGLNAMRRFHVQVPLPLMNLLMVWLLALWLIPGHGLIGASQVVFLGSLASMLTTATALFWCWRAAV